MTLPPVVEREVMKACLLRMQQAEKAIELIEPKALREWAVKSIEAKYLKNGEKPSDTASR